MGGLAYLGLDWVTYRCTLPYVLFMCTYWSSFMLSGQLLILRGFNKLASKKVAADGNTEDFSSDSEILLRVLVSSKGLLRAEKRKPGRIMRRFARKVSGSPFSLFHTTPLSEVSTCSRLLSPRHLEAACTGTTRCRPSGSCQSFLHWFYAP